MKKKEIHMADGTGLIRTEGDWIEGEKILVNGKPRKVYYSKEAGDLYIVYKCKKYFYCEFDIMEGEIIYH